MNLTSAQLKGGREFLPGEDGAVWEDVPVERTPLPLDYKELRVALQLGPNGLTTDYVNKVYALLGGIIKLFHYDDVGKIDFSRIPVYSDHERSLAQAKAGITDIEQYRSLIAAHCPEYEENRERADKLGRELKLSIERFAEFIIAFRNAASSIEDSVFMPTRTALDAEVGFGPVDEEATDAFLFNRISLILDLGEIFCGSREEALRFLSDELRERMLGSGY